jgi:hypothetical protein
MVLPSEDELWEDTGTQELRTKGEKARKTNPPLRYPSREKPIHGEITLTNGAFSTVSLVFERRIQHQ